MDIYRQLPALLRALLWLAALGFLVLCAERIVGTVKGHVPVRIPPNK